MDTPKLKAPPGACDCHIHVYEKGYAVAPTATFEPPFAPRSEYQQIQAALGLSRVNVVQPSAYGFDNTCTEKAIAEIGPGARGIAIVAPEVSDAELQRLDKAGFRGIRYFMLPGGPLKWDSLEHTAARIAELGWHINLQLDGRELPQRIDMLRRLPGNLVIDHNGKFLEPVATSDPSFKLLLGLLDTGKCWVKLAAPYETSKTGAPHYADVGALARAMVKAAPDQCLWASNWPHPNQSPRPSSAAMLDLLLEWADDNATRKKILVDNPAKVYGF